MYLTKLAEEREKKEKKTVGSKVKDFLSHPLTRAAGTTLLRGLGEQAAQVGSAFVADKALQSLWPKAVGGTQFAAQTLTDRLGRKKRQTYAQELAHRALAERILPSLERSKRLGPPVLLRAAVQGAVAGVTPVLLRRLLDSRGA